MGETACRTRWKGVVDFNKCEEDVERVRCIVFRGRPKKFDVTSTHKVERDTQRTRYDLVVELRVNAVRYRSKDETKVLCYIRLQPAEDVAKTLESDCLIFVPVRRKPVLDRGVEKKAKSWLLSRLSYAGPLNSRNQTAFDLNGRT